MTNLLLHAQPYDLSATGFYFEDYEEYEKRSSNHKNHYGDKVEEYELQFIDGKRLDGELFKAISVNQANLKAFLEHINEWQDWEKILIILATHEAGYKLDIEMDEPEQFDIDIYQVDSMRVLAEQFVDDGLYGEISDHLTFYIDYEAIARDLSIEYGETVINGQTVIYRCS